MTCDLLFLRYGGGLKGCMTRGGDSARLADALFDGLCSMSQRSDSSCRMIALILSTELRSRVTSLRAINIRFWIYRWIWQRPGYRD
jgi:hypothetical protein